MDVLPRRRVILLCCCGWLIAILATVAVVREIAHLEIQTHQIAASVFRIHTIAPGVCFPFSIGSCCLHQVGDPSHLAGDRYAFRDQTQSAAQNAYKRESLSARQVDICP